MAEYGMSYEEIMAFVDDCIERSPYKEQMKLHKAEILTAITAREDSEWDNNNANMKESAELWKNQIQKPSELLLGTRYFVIKDSIIAFIEKALVYGFFNSIIMQHSCSTEEMAVTAATEVIISLVDVIRSASKLDDFDFCIYLQAVRHFSEGKFTMSNLYDWYSDGENMVCNMHNNKWNCMHLKESDTCSMLQDAKIHRAINSLVGKHILELKPDDGVEYYSFK